MNESWRDQIGQLNLEAKTKRRYQWEEREPITRYEYAITAACVLITAALALWAFSH